MKIQVNSSQYWSRQYNSQERFFSYWYQAEEILLLEQKKVLEIGIGSSFLSNYLKNKLDVKTLDIDKELNPDVVGSVLDIPFKDNSFDILACFEVLEHLPFEDFKKALFQMHRVSEKFVVISLPDINKLLRFSVQIPKIGYIKIIFDLPNFKKTKIEFNGEHYWEIGRLSYPLKKILSQIKLSGFEVVKTYRPFETPYQRFFVLKKT